MARQSWITRLALPVLAAGCVAGSARADVVTTFIGTEPFQTVNLQATKGGVTRTINNGPVGPFNFVVLDDGGTGLGPSFRSFCADFFQDVSLGSNYAYTPVPFADLPDVGGNATKVAKIQELYDRYYDVATDDARGGAFQLALWEILYDPDTNDLSGGNFTAIGPGNPSAVPIAQSWLDTINNETIADPAQKYTLTGLLSGSAQDQIVPTTTPDPVPAPAGVVLLVIGAAGLIARRRMAGKKADAVEAADEVKA